MCLAVPAKVEELQDNDVAIVSVGGIKKQVSLMLVEDVQVGDYVILHVGFALNKINAEEAEKTLELFKQAASVSGIEWPEDNPELEPQT